MSSVPQNGNENRSKTQAPKSEAKSHKPTFGEAAERPEKTEPEGDPTTAKEPENHDGPDEVRLRLDELTEQQRLQPDPDAHQQSIHQPTTEDVLAPPVSRPHTIDPSTGQVHYAGDAAKLPSGGAEHMSDEAE